MKLNLFDWNVLAQMAVMVVLFIVVLMMIFLMKEVSAQAAHRRNLERIDKERYGRHLGSEDNDVAPEEHG